MQLVHLCIPSIVRGLKDTPEGEAAFEAMRNDKPVSDEDMCQLVVSRIQHQDCLDHGWVLDGFPKTPEAARPVSYTHLRAHETVLDLVCRLLLEKKKHKTQKQKQVRTVVIENSNIAHEK
eukprot:TRINITY_DN6942_c0_g1_i1.p1 TRINITY_DN6942_c0_g1~~TRINITY_DN6942_c0_g1_i1.p1  ORF type:complete len:120 (-),score=25.21 TRINITY_DN6942_c0_g1_i1:11-370(-)